MVGDAVTAVVTETIKIKMEGGKTTTITTTGPPTITEAPQSGKWSRKTRPAPISRGAANPTATTTYKW